MQYYKVYVRIRWPMRKSMIKIVAKKGENKVLQEAWLTFLDFMYLFGKAISK